MSLLDRINKRAQTQANTGFGTSPGNYGGRFVNKDGSANIHKRGIPLLERISWYHTLLRMPSWKFLGVLMAFYAAINFLFAAVYYTIGVEYLSGIDPNGSEWVKFGKAYFFSAQTFTTVGYGHISPNGVLASAVAATEALVGLLSFAIATGLFFGRFSKPTAFLRFSHNALISPYRGGTGLMLRMTPHKNTNLTDAEVKVMLGMTVEENGVPMNRFYALPLEFERINLLSLSWTLVHPIAEDSPLYGFVASDYESIEGELIVYVKAFDDMFSTVVASQTSYTFQEIVYGAKFEIMYTESDDNMTTILHLDRLDRFSKVDL